MRVADEVCRGYFLFDLKWDMERTWEPVEFEGGRVDWEYKPGDDPEFIYQFNRHRYFICLGQAYWITGDEKYVRHFVRLLMDWITKIKRTPETEKLPGEFWKQESAGNSGSRPCSTLRTAPGDGRGGGQILQLPGGARGVHHPDALPYRYMSNWGVMENHGLFEIGVAIPDPESAGATPPSLWSTWRWRRGWRSCGTASSGSSPPCITTRCCTATRTC